MNDQTPNTTPETAQEQEPFIPPSYLLILAVIGFVGALIVLLTQPSFGVVGWGSLIFGAILFVGWLVMAPQGGRSPIRGRTLRYGGTSVLMTILVLVALGLVHVPGTLVESWVALSVLVAGLHLWRPLWPGREGLFAAAAGLVHGAAFAEGLLGSGLSAGELALPLVAFNGGIEVAQGALALGTLPLWMTVASRPALRRAVAGAGVLAGLGWLVSLWS